MGWQQLVGVPGYSTGTAGTVIVPSGAFVHIITAHASSASATMAIFGGAAIPVPAAGTQYLYLQFAHTLFQSNVQNGGSIVFVNTDHFFVHWVRQGNV
jgi:hypothetical protein